MRSSLKLFKMRLNRILSLWLLSPLKLFLYRRKYKHVADVEKNIRIKISSIQYWYRGNRFGEITFPGEIRGGDWENKLKPKDKVLRNSNKYHGIRQRFVDGMSWRETDLFKAYEQKIKTDEQEIKNGKKIKNHEKYYHRVYDQIYESILKKGVLPADENHPNIAPIYIIIYINGEILCTVDGNHRL